MILHQCPVRLSGLVICRVRFINHRRLADPARQRFSGLRLIVDDLGMVELNAGLHYDSNDPGHCFIQTQSLECGLMCFEGARGILHAGDMYSVNTAGLAARYRHFGANDIGQRHFLRVAGGIFRCLAQPRRTLGYYHGIQGNGIVGA